LSASESSSSPHETNDPKVHLAKYQNLGDCVEFELSATNLKLAFPLEFAQLSEKQADVAKVLSKPCGFKVDRI
jgi:hypothetical protein